jgi:ParB/RepB/Spo0J family partition protein
MKSTAAAALLAADSSAESVERYHTANAEGIYENAEQVFVGMRGGNICHFLVARTPEGWTPGHKFFTRQPHNLATDLPSNIPGRVVVPTRWAALAAEAGVAMRFFSDHGTALEALCTWCETNLPDAELEALRKLAREIGLSKWANKNSCEEGPSTTVAPSQVAEDAALVTPAAPAPDAEPASTASGATGGVIFSGSCGPELTRGATGMGSTGNLATEATIPPRPHYAELGVGEIGPGDNPRKGRSAAAQAELVESIRTAGQLQPVAVLDLGEGSSPRYRLIFGEGRWLAHQTLGRATIEAKVFKGIDEATAKALALVENLLRHDMNAMDEAEGFADLHQLGWNTARMAEQTGKDLSTIRRALALTKLPEAVRALVREGKLSSRQANRLVRYVVPAGGFEAKPEGFIARPAVAEALAQAAVDLKISSDDLADGIPQAALPALVDAGALIEINSAKYFDSISGRGLFAHAPESGKYFRIGMSHHLYCWPETPWPALKKTIDKETRDAAAAKAERATKRVETAAVSRVSVPLTALKDSKAEHVVLKGDLEIYADYLPEEIVANGIDPTSQAEVLVCTQPEKLKALRYAEAKEIGVINEAAYLAAQTRAREIVRKIKKLGAREMAFVVEGTQVDFNADLGEAEVWREAGLKWPARAKALSMRAMLETLEPVEQYRLFVTATLLAEAFEETRLELLRWILGVPKIGLIEEDKREREKLLARVAKEVFAAPTSSAFGSRESGSVVDFPDRSEAQAYVNGEAARKGFAAYEVAIEKTGKTYCVRYSLGTKEVKARARAAIDAGEEPRKVALKFGLSMRDPALNGTKAKKPAKSRK